MTGAPAIPVVLDTDIGFDVDDVWALALLLRCPELDVKLVLSSTGDTQYGAALAAKLLEIDGRRDVAVGVGLALDTQERTHAAWLGGYQLSQYPGTVYQDGVGALIDCIQDSSQPVTVISIGPLANLASALVRAPDIIKNSRLIGMHGSVRRGYLDAPKPSREYNLVKHTAAAQQVFRSDWDITLTPLDTCGSIQLQGARFEQVMASTDALLSAVRENHFGWFEAIDWPITKMVDPTIESSVLFDTVAVYLALEETLDIDLVQIETLPLVLTDDAKTMATESTDGKLVRCAMDWKNKSAYLDWLVGRYT